MLYTIGFKETYDKYLVDDENAGKGVTGSVWRLRSEAESYLNDNPGYEVYGVCAFWWQTCVPHEGGIAELKIPAKLVRLKDATERLEEWEKQHRHRAYAIHASEEEMVVELWGEGAKTVRCYEFVHLNSDEVFDFRNDDFKPETYETYAGTNMPVGLAGTIHAAVNHWERLYEPQKEEEDNG